MCLAPSFPDDPLCQAGWWGPTPHASGAYSCDRACDFSTHRCASNATCEADLGTCTTRACQDGFYGEAGSAVTCDKPCDFARNRCAKMDKCTLDGLCTSHECQPGYYGVEGYYASCDRACNSTQRHCASTTACSVTDGECAPDPAHGYATCAAGFFPRSACDVPCAEAGFPCANTSACAEADGSCQAGPGGAPACEAGHCSFESSHKTCAQVCAPGVHCSESGCSARACPSGRAGSGCFAPDLATVPAERMAATLLSQILPAIGCGTGESQCNTSSTHIGRYQPIDAANSVNAAVAAVAEAKAHMRNDTGHPALWLARAGAPPLVTMLSMVQQWCATPKCDQWRAWTDTTRAMASFAAQTPAAVAAHVASLSPSDRGRWDAVASGWEHIVTIGAVEAGTQPEVLLAISKHIGIALGFTQRLP